MPTISLKLADDLTVNSNNELKVKISSASGNTLEIKDDGLYAEAKKGSSGVGGITYTKGYNGLTVNDSGVVSCTNIVHRLYPATVTGSTITLQNYRTSVDRVLPGDILRVSSDDNKYEYYLVIQTSSESYYGNSVTSKILLGEW